MNRLLLTLLLASALLPAACRNPEEAAEFRARMDAAFADTMASFSEGLAALQDDFARARVEARARWEESGEPKWDAFRAEMRARADELEEWLVDARSRFAEHDPEIREAEEELADLRAEIENSEEP